eukprot:CAMPEP_0194217550 /NCGR_PEP_ID=MMETSP0156-20130528/21591_1 /TAXON_ID=33649 /ORGANISM="Thalassionema nitzschioides, Strain L26-B" /LENGTH=521 /DNA_ID=CAMNT_0038946633 /DNA_START=44 /DNA_END=1606 /DNA_ORIENTATION=+
MAKITSSSAPDRALLSDSSDSSISFSSLIKRDWRNPQTNKDIAVLVSDLSGFTSTTRKHGIVHFASVIVRMRQLVLPIFEKYNALEITTEADNFITVFSSTYACVQAAMEMKAALKAYNATLTTTGERKHFQIKLNGIGISSGDGGLMMDSYDRFHGTTFEHAYHLGEDVCADGDILITQIAAERVRKESKLSPCLELEEFKSDEIEFQQGVFKLNFDTFQQTTKLVDFYDTTLLSKELGLLAKRHDPNLHLEELQTLDTDIAKNYSTSNQTVVMFAMKEADHNDPYDSLVYKEKALNLLRTVFSQYDGVECEEELWIFPNPSDAVLAVLDAKDAIQERNQCYDDDKIDITGWGIHMGTMLVIPNTDIHWGDPVNTASKLGQDLATNGDLIITDKVYGSIQDSIVIPNTVDFDHVFLEYSKVQFSSYKVSRPPLQIITAVKSTSLFVFSFGQEEGETTSEGGSTNSTLQEREILKRQKNQSPKKEQQQMKRHRNNQLTKKQDNIPGLNGGLLSFLDGHFKE